MFRAIRRRMTYANVVMTFGLLFAMTGGAYAARHYLITSTKQIKPSVLKQLRGRTGPAGPLGPRGSSGAQGPTGPKGENGLPGAPGEKGTSGADGKSVTLGAPTAAECKEGGVTVEIEGSAPSKKPVCNGATGLPCTASGKLPPGTTESGQWLVDTYGEPGGHAYGAVSFSCPVSPAPAFHFINEGETPPAECPGNAGEPKALSGNLCVYLAFFDNNGVLLTNKTTFALEPPSLTPVDGELGGILGFGIAKTGEAVAIGTWAVTG